MSNCTCTEWMGQGHSPGCFDRLAARVASLESEFAEAKARAEKLNGTNLALVAQNNELIRRNLALGDTENGPLVRAERANQGAGFLMAQPVAKDSWLQDESYAEFRAFYSYVSNKTNAIPACSKCHPTELFYIYSFLDHWRERVREGLEPDWKLNLLSPGGETKT